MNPAALAMPEPTQTIFLYATIVAVAGTLAYACALARRTGSIVPLLMLVSASWTIVLEPIVTFLGHAIHPPIGSITQFRAVNRTIPWHIGLGYTAGFGLVYLTMYQRWWSPGLSRRYILGTCLASVVGYFTLETLGVSLGLWFYLPHQPLYFLRFTSPPPWWILNTTCELVGITLMLGLLPLLRGWMRLWIVPLGPMGAFMGHMGAGFPMYTAMNADVPNWMVEASGIASITLALFIWWICVTVLTKGGVTASPKTEERS